MSEITSTEPKLQVGLINKEIGLVRVWIEGGLNSDLVFAVQNQLKQIKSETGLDQFVLFIDVRKAALELGKEIVPLIFDAYEIQKMTKLAVAVVSNNWIHFAFDKLSGAKSHGFYGIDEALVYLHEKFGDFDDSALRS